MEALERIAKVNGIGLGEMDLSAVPRRRVVDLARTGMRANATDLRRMSPYSKRLATLLGTEPARCARGSASTSIRCASTTRGTGTWHCVWSPGATSCSTTDLDDRAGQPVPVSPRPWQG